MLFRLLGYVWNNWTKLVYDKIFLITWMQIFPSLSFLRTNEVALKLVFKMCVICLYYLTLGIQHPIKILLSLKYFHEVPIFLSHTLLQFGYDQLLPNPLNISCLMLLPVGLCPTGVVAAPPSGVAAITNSPSAQPCLQAPAVVWPSPLSSALILQFLQRWRFTSDGRTTYSLTTAKGILFIC